MNRDNRLPEFDSPGCAIRDCGSDVREASVASALIGGTSARSERVNRTHRVVRERASILAARRAKIRSLWLPIVIFSSLLIGVCIAVWSVLEEYEVAAAGSQVAGYQVLVPLLWSIPVSAALLGVVWFRQSRMDAGTGDRP